MSQPTHEELNVAKEFHKNFISANNLMMKGQLLTKLAAMLVLVLILGTGCQTSTSQPNEFGKKVEVIGLREGDTLKIAFPGAPNLNTTQQVRPDGNIELPLGGQFKVIGMTADQLQKELMDKYASQLVTKQVTVTIESSSFPVYVTGAVLRPGKILSTRQISALEAIMEAGGVDSAKANLKAVAVTRYEGDRVMHFTLNLQGVLEGQQSEPFFLKPADILFVPEKFTWF